MSGDLRARGFARGRAAVTFVFDDEAVAAFDGDTIASALLAAGRRVLRHAPAGGGPRGPFCMMGVCQDCVVVVDGANVEACRVRVTPGLVVRSGV